MTETFDKLVDQFKKLPGVGQRQARRFAYFILQSNSSYAKELIRLIDLTKSEAKLCPVSFQSFVAKETDNPYSPIVQDPTRDKSTLMVVAKDIDLETIESTHLYKGWYFVLGGLLNILPSKKSSEKHIRTTELIKHIENRKNEIREIIFALPITPDGDFTQKQVIEAIISTANKSNIKITSLGRGLSSGTELEYIDEQTFNSAYVRRT